MKKLCFFSGKRGGFNHFVPIFQEIKKRSDMTYELIVADMHLATSFGKTLTEVQQWVDKVHCVETLMGSDSKVSRGKSVGVGILGMADLLQSLAPDGLVLLGDRMEILAPAICALSQNIPIIHLFGGDVTQGGVDEVVRHAMTKMANIHFVSTQESADRVIGMGEQPWRVHTVGSPVLDLIRTRQFASEEDTRRHFNLRKNIPTVILLQHSITWQVEDAHRQIKETLAALKGLEVQVVAVYPCSDPGYVPIVAALEQEAADNPLFSVHKNIEFPYFWGLMACAAALVGNSSAGILEAPSFGLPCVNIGIRQEGRLQGRNVIDVPHKQDKIRLAIEQALHDSTFLELVHKRYSPYGDGKAAERIVTILYEAENNAKLLHKRMTY